MRTLRFFTRLLSVAAAWPVRDRTAVRRQLCAGNGCHAPEPRSWRLAHVAPDAERLGLQPAGSDQSLECSQFENGLDSRHGARQSRKRRRSFIAASCICRNPSDLIQAFNAATGDQIWEYKREWKEDVTKILPAPSINRNLAIYGNTIIDTSADDYVFALDATSGKLVWENRILDMKESPSQETSGPIIAKGKIFSGRGCEAKKSALACVIVAHDAKTGKELWRTRTIPMPGEPGDETWGGIPYEKRSHVGTWMVPSYDPELNLLYVGTSVTSPAPKFMLAGNDFQYLYHNSTLALNADTGKIVWYYQHLVDHWDFDHPFERLLVDTAVAPSAADVSWINPRIKPGERRKVITGIPGKTGIVYTLDRQTGEFLWAKPTVMQNVVASIDGATGRVRTNPETLFTAVGQQRFVCPTVNGGKNFQAGAYSPLTNTMYYALQNACANVTAIADTPTTAYAIQNNNQIAPGTDKIGTVQAISVETGKTVWKYEQRAGYMSLVATGGGLIFGGDTNGHFRAFDQNTGRRVVGYQSRIAGDRISDHVCGSGQAVCRGQHGQFAGEFGTESAGA